MECQTISVRDYAEATELTINQVHYRIEKGEIPSIKSGKDGLVLIPKGSANIPGYRPIEPLSLPAVITGVEAAEAIGFSYQTFRTWLGRAPGALITFPLGRGIGVTVESLSKLLGSPPSHWPELPRKPLKPRVPKMITPSNAEVALAVLPEIRHIVETLQVAIDGLAAWLEKLSELEPQPINAPVSEGEAVTGQLGIDLG